VRLPHRLGHLVEHPLHATEDHLGFPRSHNSPQIPQKTTAWPSLFVGCYTNILKNVRIYNLLHAALDF
jgi:hypothetical protein